MPNGITDGHRWHNGFLKSNLFVFLLGQGFAFICWLCIFAFSWGKYSERFDGHDKRIRILESTQKTTTTAEGSIQNIQSQETREIAELRTIVERVEKETSHFDVMEYEHRRLTEDVEKLKDARKK
jgi:hypothetical protein